MMFSQSKYYVDNLAENIKCGKRNRVRNGYWPSSAPMGYVNNKGSRTMEIDPARAPMVREMFELYSTGNYTFKELLARMLRNGFQGLRGRTLSEARVQHALQNPFYYGVMRFRGEYFDGKHTPLISQRLFDRCQEVMKDRGRVKAPEIKRFEWSGSCAAASAGAASLPKSRRATATTAAPRSGAAARRATCVVTVSFLKHAKHSGTRESQTSLPSASRTNSDYKFKASQTKLELNVKAPGGDRRQREPYHSIGGTLS